MVHMATTLLAENGSKILKQLETQLIVEPFRNLLSGKYGWYVEKTHGSQFQQGFPDLYIMHKKYEPRWVECKVIRNGDVSFCVF